MEETISISDIFNTLKKRWKLIVFLAVVAALISGGITYFVITPVYHASTQILVNQKNENNQIDATQLKVNIDVINTYSVIIKSPAILDKVKANLNLTESVAQLNQKITVNSQDNSQVFSLAVQHSNPAMSVQIANEVAETFQREIPAIMNVDNVTILAKAENPIHVGPNPLLNISIAVVVGLMLGIGLAFLLEYLDNTLKDERDVEIYLGLPVLGSIHKFSPGKQRSRIQKVGSEHVAS
ncbi:YveK family protein [Peribacillus huizhouensis]|uniref:Capsular polysaccharide biosynthesis protein n=1 Tax=Peribacillus huizhouensis TaxID=1501239 RepID=A0ABR6CM67_9BACI|nr:Wzz/FepE/Etk N-terminal domain-containing protein [Peribacillus huizhouensis]MBA9025665.1 capsular polysaccharide biosynthesis protein [Peribacillus huizhouensis]